MQDSFAQNRPIPKISSIMLALFRSLKKEDITAATASSACRMTNHSNQLPTAATVKDAFTHDQRSRVVGDGESAHQHRTTSFISLMFIDLTVQVSWGILS